MTVKVGILGAGRHALQSHVKPMLQLGATVAVYDPDPKVEKHLPNGVVRFSSEDELVEKSDCVIICSPDRFHTPSLSAVTQAGKACLVEKPISVDAEDLAVVEKILEDDTTIVSTCHPRRLDPPFMFVRRHIPMLMEMFGNVSSFGFNFDYPPPRVGQPNIHTSLLADHFGHEIDLLEWMFGTCETKGANTLNPNANPVVSYQVEGFRQDGINFLFTGERTNLNRLDYSESLSLSFHKDDVIVEYNFGTGVYKTMVAEKVLQQGAVPRTDYKTRFLDVNRNFLNLVTMVDNVKPYVSKRQMWRNTYSAVELDSTGSFLLQK